MPSPSDKKAFEDNEKRFRRNARKAQAAHNLKMRNSVLRQKVQRQMQAEARDDDNEYHRNVQIFDKAFGELQPLRGYESVLSILLQLLNFYTKLAPLLCHNFGEAFNEIWGISHFNEGWKSVKTSLRVQKELWLAEDPGPIVLPVITHKVSLDDNNVLIPNPLQFLQDVVTNQPLKPDEGPRKYDFNELNAQFLKVVDGWLQLHPDKPAYKVNADNKVYTYDVDTGTLGTVALTKEEFERLRDKPDSGLAAYMQKNLRMQSEVVLDANPTPKPTF